MNINIRYDHELSYARYLIISLSHIPVEAWRYPGERGVDLLTRVFNTSWESERMPEERRRGILIPEG